MATRLPPLNAKKAENAKCPASGQTELIDGEVPGLRLRLSAGGSRTWELRVRDMAGRMRRVTLGHQDGDDPMRLAAARDRAREWRIMLKRGEDPTAAQKGKRARAKAAADGRGTLAELLTLYPGKTRVGRPAVAWQPVSTSEKALHDGRRWSEAEKRIRSVFAVLLDVPALDITNPMIQRAIDGHPSPASAARALAYIRPVMKWAAKRGTAPKGLARSEDVEAPRGTTTERDRVLSHAEVQAVLTTLGETKFDHAMRFLLLTATRISEVTGATWSEIDLVKGVWTISATRTKQQREHKVYLSRQAVSVLRKVIPEKVDGSALVFPSEAGTELGNLDRRTKALHADSETKGWHRHDLRRTAATLAAECGVGPHLVEKMLGHKLAVGEGGQRLSEVAATYNRSDYALETADAFQRLADHLDVITSGANNVVRIGVCA